MESKHGPTTSASDEFLTNRPTRGLFYFKQDKTKSSQTLSDRLKLDLLRQSLKAKNL